MKMYSFRIYPSNAQDKEMIRQLFLAKNLWNDILARCKIFYNDFGKFPSKRSIAVMTKNSGMYSQAAQEVGFRVEKSIWHYIAMKKKGMKIGFPRFKSIDRLKSLNYPQSGFSLGKKIKVTPIGEISIVQHREIKGSIKTLTLKRKSSGKWFACFAVEEIPFVKVSNSMSRIGIDLGLKKLATLSDGTTVTNPKILRMHGERLARLQRQFSGKKKSSQNRKRMKRKVAFAYEKVANARKDFLHKLSHNLVNSYSLIALEDLTSQEMAKQKFGKQINDAGWDTLANMLRYKAESAGCEIVFVNPEGTTKTCCICESRKDMPLTERTYLCDVCGNHMDRDLNAAYNILKRATEGHSGSNACGEASRKASAKQEAHTLDGGGMPLLLSSHS